ncbi:hypothetical protein FSP39_016602 [Pinctada imbricata]|uniref:PH domain-containing protein n=1 Tax=Pinctada imbricata TaxID=66713 RepID=A0AA88XHH7_PINIB|nr:hypothetical protein FSP39_016602 [Pinctada imbricata]
MRINEKSLAKFATSGAPADKEGILMKKGEVNKGYQKRWFVLKGNLLFYYEKRNDKEPIGLIICEGCTIELSENTDGFAFQIVFPKSGCRTYHLAANSQEEMEAWMKVLSCASYDYMRLMVSELKQQLEDIQENSKALLVENAMRDSHIFSNRYSSFQSQTSKEEDDLQGRRNARVNPFNSRLSSPSSFSRSSKDMKESGDLLNLSDSSSSGNVVYRHKYKSFTEMHMDYGRQVKTLSELWKDSYSARPTSGFDFLTK